MTFSTIMAVLFWCHSKHRKCCKRAWMSCVADNFSPRGQLYEENIAIKMIPISPFMSDFLRCMLCMCFLLFDPFQPVFCCRPHLLLLCVMGMLNLGTTFSTRSCLLVEGKKNCCSAERGNENSHWRKEKNTGRECERGLQPESYTGLFCRED